MLDEFLPRVLREAFEEELFQMLPGGDFGSSSTTIRRFCSAMTHPGMPSHSLSGSLLIDHLRLCPSLRRGEFVADQSAQETEPLRFAVPPAMAGAHAVLGHLRSRGVNIDVDYRFAHSREVTRQIIDGTLEGTHDGCVVAIAVAAASGLLSENSRSCFKPIMLMPQTSHRVIASGSDESWDGEYFFMSDSPGTAAVYYEELLVTRQLKKIRTRVTHCEPDKVAGIFRAGGPGARAIIWFPHYYLIRSLCGASVIDGHKDSLAHQGTLLFVHERIARDVARVASLQSQLIAAWTELARSKMAIRNMAERLTADSDYCRYLAGCGGFVFDGHCPGVLPVSEDFDRFRLRA